MTNLVFSEITKFKFKVPITSRSASYSPLQGSPSSQAITPALDFPFLLLWSQRIDLFWPFPLCQEPPAFPVSTSQIPAFLQFCLWPIGCWGDPACSWGLCQMSVSQSYLWEAEAPLLCSTWAGLGVSDHNVGWGSAQKGQGLPFIYWLIQKYHPFSNFLRH